MADLEPIIFRGAELRSGSWAIEEGGPIHRVKFLADISDVATRALGCEDEFYSPGGELLDAPTNKTIDGMKRVESWVLEPTDMNNMTLKSSAIEMDFTIKHAAGEDGEKGKTRIHLIISTTASLADIEAYARTAGTMPGSLVVYPQGYEATATQMNLGDDIKPKANGKGRGKEGAISSKAAADRAQRDSQGAEVTQ